jgi:hypothetical protein
MAPIFTTTYTPEQISARDAGFLRAACRIPDYDPKTGEPNLVPESVSRFYWQVKQHFDRVGGTIFQPDTYAMIAAIGSMLEPVMAGQIPPVVGEKVAENIATLWYAKKLTFDSPVQVYWREEWKNARIHNASVNRKQITLMIDGESEARRVATDTVRLPEPEEAFV